MLSAEETTRLAGGGNSIKSERDKEADWRRTNQEKERRLKKNEVILRKQHRKTRSRKAEGSYSAAQKAEEIRRKIESGSIVWLMIAKSRLEKKAERRSKN